VSDHYDLRTEVRKALAEGGCDSFREYAERVLDRMPRDGVAYRFALMATLPDYIRDLDRRDAGRLVLPAVPSIPSVASLPRPAAPAGSNGSARLEAMAGQEWGRMTARHIITPDGHTKRLADATRDEVMHYAGMLSVKGQQVLDTAEAYNRLADLMLELKVGHVRDVPPALGSAALQKVAL
jgi:hypothetical protein